jgi:hypothetical protein
MTSREMGFIILTNKGLVLHARSEGCVTGLVAKLEPRRLGYSVLFVPQMNLPMSPTDALTANRT